MRTRKDLADGCANIIRDLRQKSGLSRAKMSDLAYIDPHTLKRWEDGSSAPSVPEFVALFDAVGMDALRPVLDFLYPDVYQAKNGSVDEMRAAAAFYFSNLASERMVREWHYLMFGGHGSNIEPQMAEFTMLDKLPMCYRFAIARMIKTFWDLSEARGELICDDVRPDMDLFLDGLKKGEEAAKVGSNSYTTAVEK